MGHIPFGYRIEDGEAVIDETSAEKLKILYANYLSGMALVTAAYEAGIDTYHGTVSKMLANRRYLGDSFYPQIIDAETFHAAQVERKKRAKSLGRDHFVSEPPVLEVPTEFSIRPAIQHFDDLQEQAEYIYSLIESEF
ncbi:MAG: recombinase [Clostridia bacterium]|nr:recombinase [Clostridia bacterium]